MSFHAIDARRISYFNRVFLFRENKFIGRGENYSEVILFKNYSNEKCAMIRKVWYNDTNIGKKRKLW